MTHAQSRQPFCSNARVPGEVNDPDLPALRDAKVVFVGSGSLGGPLAVAPCYWIEPKVYSQKATPSMQKAVVGPSCSTGKRLSGAERPALSGSSRLSRPSEMTAKSHFQTSVEQP